MISIIICSRTPEINSKFSQNIEETIGCSHELIVIDNSKNNFSIFEAYNLGIAKSKGDYWCFVHDDVLFHTHNWGTVLSNIFEDNLNIGLIGIAGTKIKTKTPSAWFHCDERFKFNYLIQHFGQNKVRLWERGFTDNPHEQVACVDGVFMVGRRNHRIRFDERITGFHNYDINLSIAYHEQNYDVIVTKKILLEHFSIGKIDKSWYLSTLQFNTVLGNYLPIMIPEVVKKTDLRSHEIENGINFCTALMDYDLEKYVLRYWWHLFLLKPLSIFHYYFFKIYVYRLIYKK